MGHRCASGCSSGYIDLEPRQWTRQRANPDSGPGKERIEAFSSQAERCRGAGQRVLGYVSSDYARRDVKEVLQDIEKYRSWFAIDGFFIDEVYCTGMVLPGVHHQLLLLTPGTQDLMPQI